MVTDLFNIKNNWVYQSNKLIEASYTLSVLEQKILRVLASMIKKEDIDFKEYEFKATDLSKLIGSKDNKNIYRELDKLTDSLMARIVKIKDADSKNFEKYHFVEVAKYQGGILKLKINPEMKPFYINLDWYTRYQLKNIMQFKSTYSFRLYELLKQYEKIGYREVDIEKLRDIFDIKKNEYPKYANLKQKVIIVSVNEINTNTDLFISFDEIKTSRKVTSLKFYIRSVPSNEIAATEDHGPHPVKGQLPQHTDDGELMNDLKKIQNIMYEHDIDISTAKMIYDSAQGNLEIIKKVYDDKKNTNAPNFIGLMRSLVKPGAYIEPKRNYPKNNFNNYDQRKYDMKDLEKKLLGVDEEE